MNAITLHPDPWRMGPERGGNHWLGVWEMGQSRIPPARLGQEQAHAALSLLLEFRMPLVATTVPLRLWQGAADARRAIGLYAQRDGVLRLVHDEVDISTSAGFAQPGEMIGMRYLSCARGRGDLVEFVNHGQGQGLRLHLGIAQATRLDEALPRHHGFLKVCHVAAIAGFHVCASNIPAIGAGARLPTTDGLVAVEDLRPDMALIVTEGPPMPLRWISRRSRLCLGQLAPILLRAPYFGLAQDIVTTLETRVMRTGPAVEYLFDHERVLISAGDLTSSPGALRDRRVPVRDMYHLMLDDHACVAIDRCGVETALLSDVVAAEDGGGVRNLSPTDRTPCLPVLDRAGAQALIAHAAKGRRARRARI